MGGAVPQVRNRKWPAAAGRAVRRAGRCLSSCRRGLRVWLQEWSGCRMPRHSATPRRARACVKAACTIADSCKDSEKHTTHNLAAATEKICGTNCDRANDARHRAQRQNHRRERNGRTASNMQGLLAGSHGVICLPASVMMSTGWTRATRRLCETAHFALQNAPFHRAKRHVSEAQTARFATHCVPGRYTGA